MSGKFDEYGYPIHVSVAAEMEEQGFIPECRECRRLEAEIARLRAELKREGSDE